MDRSLNILLVDDEEVVHQTIAGYLVDLGHQVDQAYDGLEALKSIKNHDYDIAIVDIRMPGIDGLSLLARIQETHPDISVVIVTGHGNMETVIQALRLGAVDFLEKPVKLLELDAVLEKSALVYSLRKDKRRLREAISGIQALGDLRERNRSLVGNSPATLRVRAQIQQAVEANCETILRRYKMSVYRQCRKAWGMKKRSKPSLSSIDRAAAVVYDELKIIHELHQRRLEWKSILSSVKSLIRGNVYL